MKFWKKAASILLAVALLITMLPDLSQRADAADQIEVTTVSKTLTGEDIPVTQKETITPGQSKGLILNSGDTGYVLIYYNLTVRMDAGSLDYKITKGKNQVKVHTDADPIGWGCFSYYKELSADRYSLSLSYVKDGSYEPAYTYDAPVELYILFIPSKTGSSFSYTYSSEQIPYTYNGRRSPITVTEKSTLTLSGWDYDFEQYMLDGNSLARLRRTDRLVMTLYDITGNQIARETMSSKNGFSYTKTLEAGVYYLYVSTTEAKEVGVYTMSQSLTPVPTPTAPIQSAAPGIQTPAPAPTLPADPSKALMVSVCTVYASPQPASHEITLSDQDGDTAVLPVFVPRTGYLQLHFEADASDPADTISLQLYTDEACSGDKQIGPAMSFAGTAVDPDPFEITTAGTYYLKASYPAGTTAKHTVLATGYEIPSDRAELTAKEQIFRNPSADPSGYHSFVVKKTAYVRLSGKEYVQDTVNPLSIRLLSPEMTQLGNTTFQEANQYAGQYCLTPGTYTVASSGTAIYGLSATVKTWKNQAGASRKKAARIKKGKTLKGCFPLSTKKGKTGWYKVTLTRKKTLALDVSNYSDHGYIRVTVTAKGKHFKKSVTKVKAGRIATVRSTRKLKAGTYYIKVQKVKKAYDSAYLIKYRK